MAVATHNQAARAGSGRGLRASRLRTPPGLFLDVALGAIIVFVIALSPMMLAMLGYNYDTPAGSALEKIHPATYVALPALVLFAFHAGGPYQFANTIVRDFKLFCVFMLTLAVILLHTMLVQRQPMMPLIDTFVLSGIIFLLSYHNPAYRARNLALIIHGLMVANALIGLGEFLTGLRVTPFMAGGVLIPDDWRSTALLGHPLINACMTGCYILCLALGGGRDLPRPVALGAALLSIMALASFGGRAATVLTIAMLMAIAGWQVLLALQGRRMGMVQIVLVLAAIPFGALAIAIAAELGLFDRFISRFVDDAGSADVRIAMLDLFDYVSTSELLWGPDPAYVEGLKVRLGLDYGIESAWLGFIFMNGLVVALIFFAGFGLFIYEVCRASRPGAIVVWAFFLIVVSTNVGISGKTALLSLLVMYVMILLRKPDEPARAFAGTPPQPEQRGASLSPLPAVPRRRPTDPSWTI